MLGSSLVPSYATELHRFKRFFFSFFFALSFFCVGCCEFGPLLVAPSTFLVVLEVCVCVFLRSILLVFTMETSRGPAEMMLTLLCTDVTEHLPKKKNQLIAPDLCCPPANRWRLRPLFNQLEVALKGPVVG